MSKKSRYFSENPVFNMTWILDVPFPENSLSTVTTPCVNTIQRVLLSLKLGSSENYKLGVYYYCCKHKASYKFCDPQYFGKRHGQTVVQSIRPNSSNEKLVLHHLSCFSSLSLVIWFCGLFLFECRTTTLT